MKIFDKGYVELLCADAALNPRKRQYRNIHHSYQDPCQRLFNAIEPGSYIRPHRHLSCARDELLIVVRGLMALVEFDPAKVMPVTIDLAAEAPEQHIKPKRSLIVALSGVVGGMLAIMFVLIRNAVRNRKA